MILALLIAIIVIQIAMIFIPFLPIKIIKTIHGHTEIPTNTLMVPYQLVLKYEDVILELERVNRLYARQIEMHKQKLYVDNKVTNGKSKGIQT